MAIYLGILEFDPSIRSKVNGKHHVTPDEVREALQWPARAETAWEEHPEHGRRVVALGSTADGREVVAWLLPLPHWDDGTDTWIVKTARWV